MTQTVDTIQTEHRFKSIIAVVAALMCMGVALYSYRYVAAIGFVPPIVGSNAFRYPWLVVHVASAATALLIGPFQFSSKIRQRAISTHRWTGRIYVASCFVGGISGLWLAFGISTGPVSAMGFGSLSVVWLLATALAWRAAMQRRIADHRAWMIRSFALTFAAVTLRLYIPILLLLPVPFVAGYQFIAFACWVPNIIVAEFFLSAKYRKPSI
ncbi:DUF2306 domain-containing protein [Bradyrhizobium sp. USDA 4486]